MSEPATIYDTPKATLEDSNKKFDNNEQIIKIAKAQRYLLVSFLFTIIFNFVPHVAGAIIALLFGIAFIYSVASLTNALYNSRFIGVFSALASLIPLFGLVIVIARVSQSTKRLKAAGFKVGLLGVSKKQISAASDSNDKLVLDDAIPAS